MNSLFFLIYFLVFIRLINNKYSQHNTKKVILNTAKKYSVNFHSKKVEKSNKAFFKKFISFPSEKECS